MFDPADWGLLENRQRDPATCWAATHMGESLSKVVGFGLAIVSNVRGLVAHETTTVVTIRASELRRWGAEGRLRVLIVDPELG
jgi:hypothetical protein